MTTAVRHSPWRGEKGKCSTVTCALKEIISTLACAAKLHIRGENKFHAQVDVAYRCVPPLSEVSSEVRNFYQFANRYRAEEKAWRRHALKKNSDQSRRVTKKYMHLCTCRHMHMKVNKHGREHHARNGGTCVNS